MSPPDGVDGEVSQSVQINDRTSFPLDGVGQQNLLHDKGDDVLTARNLERCTPAWNMPNRRFFPLICA